ncbi:MAG: DsbA family protein [Pseudomonadota bacterium]|nr:DsbA family protein [Pseudomonadota bacterium]
MRKAALFFAAAILAFSSPPAYAVISAVNPDSTPPQPPMFAPSPAAAANTAPSAAAPGAPAPSAPAVEAKVYSDAERAGIEAVIKDYLTKEHPEVLMMAAQALEKRESAEAQTKTEEAIGKSQDKLYQDASSPVAGDPHGDVTIVEFFDYQCGYCKMSEEGIEKLLKNDKKVKFIYKDYPILGPASVQAAKASFASIRQGKYLPLHDALMNKKEHLTDEAIYQAAKDVGLNVDKLKKDMADPAIQKMVDDNVALGTQIGVRGTPMFIINGQIFPGALQYDQLNKIVQDVRIAGTKS